LPQHSPIGIFDSGYGGLTVFKEIVSLLPQYDYIYLGDNGRAPYGNRSYQTVLQYTRECVEWFFSKGCQLVILACNTASAKALRTIQQQDLPNRYPGRRVLGVIRPTAEVIGKHTHTGHIGILGTKGTIQSKSYVIEIEKFYPDLRIFQQACPIWVPLIEYGEYQNDGASYFVRKYLDQLMSQSTQIDTILLACTHYPILLPAITSVLGPGIKVISQGVIVASSLHSYLTRHSEIRENLSITGNLEFFTTDDHEDFENHASIFFGKKAKAQYLNLFPDA
jgi:glutamate racemase